MIFNTATGCAGGIHDGHVVRGVYGSARDVAACARAHVLHASRKPEGSKMSSDTDSLFVHNVHGRGRFTLLSRLKCSAVPVVSSAKGRCCHPQRSKLPQRARYREDRATGAKTRIRTPSR
jgi:hypothetical protein